jgi:hypothetical protein
LSINYFNPVVRVRNAGKKPNNFLDLFSTISTKQRSFKLLFVGAGKRFILSFFAYRFGGFLIPIKPKKARRKCKKY